MGYDLRYHQLTGIENATVLHKISVNGSRSIRGLVGQGTTQFAKTFLSGVSVCASY
jgi:hypothetical protein